MTGQRGANWERIVREHDLGAKATDEVFWREHLRDNPEVLHRLLHDLYVSTRPDRSKPPTLDDLWDLMAPKFSTEPFGEAVHAALNGRSVRWLAREIYINLSSLQRLLSGEREIVSLRDPKGSMARIEAVARALKVHPSYFAEWRRLWVLLLISEAFEVQPNLSIGVYQRFAGHEVKHGRRRDLAPASTNVERDGK